MKKTFLLIALISVAISSFAQEKKMLTPMDAAYQNRSIYPVGKNVKWLTNTDKYIFTEGNDLMIQNANAKKASVMLTLDQVNSYLNQAEWTASNVFQISHGSMLTKLIITAMTKIPTTSTLTFWMLKLKT